MKLDVQNCIIIFLIALAIRLPLYHTPFWRTNDAIEYINIARNLNAGQGITLSIKNLLYDASPVVSQAIKTRPVLTSVLYAGLLKINSDVYFLQIFNLLLGAFNACLVYILAKHFVSRKVALLGGILAALNPNSLITGRLILSDQLFAALSLLAFIAFYRIKSVARKYLLTGFLIGLLTLTRLEGAILFLVLCVITLNKPRYLVTLILSFCLTLSPYFFASLRLSGSPVQSYGAIHYQTFKVDDSVAQGFEKSYPPPLVFIRNNSGWVVKAVITSTAYLTKSLFEFGYFGPLIILLILSFLQSWKKYGPLYLYCLLVFLLFCSLWSANFEPDRNFLFLYFLLLIPTMDFLQHYRRNKILFLIIVLTLFGYLAYDYHRIVWARDVDPHIGSWNPPAKEQAYLWIENHTNRSDIVTATNPFMVNLQTQRPTISLPANLNEENYSRFLGKFNVRYILSDDKKISNFFNGKESLVAVFPDASIYRVVPSNR